MVRQPKVNLGKPPLNQLKLMKKWKINKKNKINKKIKKITSSKFPSPPRHLLNYSVSPWKEHW